MIKHIFAVFLAIALLMAGGQALAATQVSEDGDTYIIFNRPTPDAVYNVGDTVTFAGKIRVNSCGDGLFFNRVKFYIAECGSIPLTTATPAVYNDCFGARSTNYDSCVGIPRAAEVQILDTTKGYKIHELGTVYPPDITGYHGEGGFNWVEFNKSYIVPNVGFRNACFYVEFSGTHWTAHWHWDVAYQHGTIVAPPESVTDCDNSRCGIGSSCDGNIKCYEPTAQPDSCVCTIIDTSTPTDFIEESKWCVKPAGAAEDQCQTKLKCTNPGLPCDYTLQNDLAPGDYVAELRVTDRDGRTSTSSTNIHIASEINCDFKCSLTNNGTDWQNCNNLADSVMKGEKVFLKDFSQPSEGATMSSLKWTLNEVAYGTGSSANFDANKTDNIRLNCTDSIGRSDYSQYTLNSNLLPKYKEISPSAQ